MEGEFLEEPLHILDLRLIMLWNRYIVQVKVQRNHFNTKEVTWELGDVFEEAYESRI